MISSDCFSSGVDIRKGELFLYAIFGAYEKCLCRNVDRLDRILKKSSFSVGERPGHE
jgi:hypothetical protein